MLRSLFRPLTDRRAERMLGATAVSVVLVIVAMIVFIAIEAWPSFQHNGLSWFGSGKDVDAELGAMVNAGADPSGDAYQLRAWPLLYATALTTVLAVGLGVFIAVLASIFIVELAPPRVRSIVVPVVRLLAAVPSVVYGLIGILVLVPFVNDHLINEGQRESVSYVITLNGPGLLVSVVLLTLMITPIMISIVVDALTAVPRGWREGALALGVTRWRAVMSVSVRAIRPAIVAAAVLASARALGEAIMLSMVSGSKGFSPQPWDGLIFLFEPLRPLAATIAEQSEGIAAPALKSSIYAMALVLLVSSLFLSIGGSLIKRRLRLGTAR
ncbi:phosphate ABC transporter permease subunit PstC [Patulibacter minatonensis]|uniref:phosphate ABC transporter permease subunit PstC n=1 Tax=Patulibacter minatonensis TaxID=298163 RepID=UPI000478A46F|nr:phosphate ABC transporter permease subunit PstC [Patulibacter minatonensis]